MDAQITKIQLQAMLEKINGETEIMVTVKGDAKMNKTNNPFYEKQGRAWVEKDKVEKIQTSVYAFGGSYEEMVNEALIADGSAGDFKAASLPWGEWIVEGKTISHNGKVYIRCYIVEGQTEILSVDYLVNGKEATPEQVQAIKDFTPEKKPSAKQENAGLAQGKQVIPNNIDLDKVVCVEIGGTIYEIV
jgi:hypothetical protein